MRPVLPVLLLTAILAVALLTNTDVVTLFESSHTITNLASDANDIDCKACHGWVADELKTSAIHANLKCEECHRMQRTAEGKKIVFATHNTSGIYPGEQAHACYTPRCLDCHGGNGWWVNDTGVWKRAPPAPAFNESGYGSDVSAHKPLVELALKSNLSVGENEACLACHTDYRIKFEYRRPLYFNFTIDSNWNIIVHGYGPTNQTLVIKEGNGAKHRFLPVNQIRCESCHADIWMAINTTSPSGLAYYSSSHVVVWKIKGSRGYIHNPNYIGISYTNITEYCLLSCHNPRVGSNSQIVPPELSATVHAARRISCYDCHNSSYSFYVYDKPLAGSYVKPTWRGKHAGKIEYNLGDVPLFLHGDTCVACKRAGAPNPPCNIISYTEPNITVFVNGNKY